MGAFHALNFAFRRADLFPVALCLSGNYDPTVWNAWGDRGDALHFSNPSNCVANLHGEHLDWLRGRLSIVPGLWAGPVGGHHRRARVDPPDGGESSPTKESGTELDLWGTDTAHDWPAWRARLAHHLPRLC